MYNQYKIYIKVVNLNLGSKYRRLSFNFTTLVNLLNLIVTANN